MRKRRCIYFAAETAAAAVSALLSPAAPWAAATAFALFTLWWTLYFRSLSCTVSGGALHLRSGVFFAKSRVIPLSSILRTTRLTVPFSEYALLTVIHTAGGNSVIFADISTECIINAPHLPEDTW